MQSEDDINSFNQSLLKPPKDAILNIIKIKGGATVDHISQELAIPATTIRQHLATLERDRIIKTITVKHGAGRPKILYCLTELGNNLFPKRYDFLLNIVLDEIERIDGPEKVDLIFDNIAERIFFLCQFEFAGKSTEEKLETMTQLVRIWGSMAECNKINENLYVIKEYNCDFYNSVLKYNVLSKFALKILQKVFKNATLDCKLETNQSSGADVCSFYIKF